MRQIIETSEAPAAIGTYSQATRHGSLIFLSGQIGLDPGSMELVSGGVEAQIRQVFENLSAVCRGAGASLDGILKLTVFLADMEDFPAVNQVMGEYFTKPYPARAAIGVAALPRGAAVEMDAILAVNEGL